jgi:hypothetical protein
VRLHRIRFKLPILGEAEAVIGIAALLIIVLVAMALAVLHWPC